MSDVASSNVASNNVNTDGQDTRNVQQPTMATSTAAFVSPTAYSPMGYVNQQVPHGASGIPMNMNLFASPSPMVANTNPALRYPRVNPVVHTVVNDSATTIPSISSTHTQTYVDTPASVRDSIRHTDFDLFRKRVEETHYDPWMTGKPTIFFKHFLKGFVSHRPDTEITAFIDHLVMHQVYSFETLVHQFNIRPHELRSLGA